MPQLVIKCNKIAVDLKKFTAILVHLLNIPNKLLEKEVLSRTECSGGVLWKSATFE